MKTPIYANNKHDYHGLFGSYAISRINRQKLLKISETELLAHKKKKDNN